MFTPINASRDDLSTTFPVSFPVVPESAGMLLAKKRKITNHTLPFLWAIIGGILLLNNPDSNEKAIGD
jgi:hypothetical protein